MDFAKEMIADLKQQQKKSEARRAAAKELCGKLILDVGQAEYDNWKETILDVDFIKMFKTMQSAQVYKEIIMSVANLSSAIPPKYKVPYSGVFYHMNEMDNDTADCIAGDIFYNPVYSLRRRATEFVLDEEKARRIANAKELLKGAEDNALSRAWFAYETQTDHELQAHNCHYIVLNDIRMNWTISEMDAAGAISKRTMQAWRIAETDMYYGLSRKELLNQPEKYLQIAAFVTATNGLASADTLKFIGAGAIPDRYARLVQLSQNTK